MKHLIQKLTNGGEYVSLPKLLEEAKVTPGTVPAYRLHLALVVATNAYINRGGATLADAIRILKEPGTTFPMVFPRQVWQDLTGTPMATDLAALQYAFEEAGGNLEDLDLVTTVHCVLDHSGEDEGGSFKKNLKLEIMVNGERYGILEYLNRKFPKFFLVPPGKSIIHQANAYHFSKGIFEYAPGVWGPDACCGLDSHTPTVGAVSVVSKGLGGVDALPQLFGKAIPFANSPVVRVKLKGNVSSNVQATDLALIVAEAAANVEFKDRDGQTRTGIDGCVLEFDAPDVEIETVMAAANMGPEHQAFTTFKAASMETIKFLRSVGHEAEAELYLSYLQEQNLLNPVGEKTEYATTIEINMDDYSDPSFAGLVQPDVRFPASDGPRVTAERIEELGGTASPVASNEIHDGIFGIASISSCTASTSMYQMFSAAMVAKALDLRGVKIPSWVKTSFTPGSEAVVEFLTKAGLMEHMENMGYALTGYGCGTCIGNSGKLNPETHEALENGTKVFTITSSNRNFEDRIIKKGAGSILCNPSMVILGACAGSALVDLTSDAGFATDAKGKPVLLSEVIPSADEVYALMRNTVSAEVFKEIDRNLYTGGEDWNNLKVQEGNVYQFNLKSHTLARPPFFDLKGTSVELTGARVLAHFYDDEGADLTPVTTDHISPVNELLMESPAATLLREKFEVVQSLKYGRLRGHWEMMVRGTFANAQLRNRLMPDGRQGQWSLDPNGNPVNLFKAAMAYKEQSIPLVLFAHDKYASGSSRDWAAKGTRLLGVNAVIAELIATIHRSNLVALGVVPIHMEKKSAQLDLNGSEEISIQYPNGFGVNAECLILANGSLLTKGIAQIYDPAEVAMIEAGGVCPLFIQEKFAQAA